MQKIKIKIFSLFLYFNDFFYFLTFLIFKYVYCFSFLKFFNHNVKNLKIVIYIYIIF